jgi:hypothetical protein
MAHVHSKAGGPWNAGRHRAAAEGLGLAGRRLKNEKYYEQTQHVIESESLTF